jgi:hypothetical protein
MPLSASSCRGDRGRRSTRLLDELEQENDIWREDPVDIDTFVESRDHLGLPPLFPDPPLSCLAALFGSFTLELATVGTYVAGTQRAQRAQQLVGLAPLSGWLMLALAVFTLAVFTLGFGCPIHFQTELNKVWQTITSTA